MMISRLISFVLLFVACSFGALADPVPPPAPTVMYQVSMIPTSYGKTAWAESAAVACDNAYTLWKSFQVPPSGSSIISHEVYGSQCMGGTTSNPHQLAIGGIVTDTRCPPSGTAPVGGACPVPPPDCSSSNPYKARQTFASYAQASTTLPGVEGGCKVTVNSIVSCQQDIATSVYTCDYMVSRTGQAADAGDTRDMQKNPPAPDPKTTDRSKVPPTPPQTPSSKCPGGTVQGGSDSSGIPICIGTGTAEKLPPTNPGKTTSPTTTTTAADGTSTAVKTITQKNMDGSTTTTTETTVTAPDGTVTTSSSASTSNAAASGAAGHADTPEDKSDLCLRNPTLSICRNSSVSGTCGTISCEGDAIQCATLRAAAAMECKGRADTDALTASSQFALGSAAAGGNDPLKSTFPSVANASVVNVPTSLDSSGWLGGGSCFVDKTFVFRGQSITIPFSQTCDALLVLRYALMVVAGLVSFRILSSAILT